MTRALIVAATLLLASGGQAVPKEQPRRRHITVTATAYCPCAKCCGKWAKYKKTRTGSSALTPGIAVDPRHIPLGATLKVPGYNQGRPIDADDVGSKIRGARIDVRMKTHHSARKWGRKLLTVELTDD
jgi:3D (Asp-Asp-Asp) domain-containing protein